LPPIILDDDIIYKGQWNKYGKRHGYGISKFPDGSIYEGFYENKKSIRGISLDNEGNYYEGGFLFEKANGIGNYVRIDGTKYSGNWVNGYQEGSGTEYYADIMATYTGRFVKGEKHGYGTLEMNDGSKYTGNFENNLISGLGLYIWGDGRKYDGNWRNNKMEGYGIYIWPDSRRYEGEYKNDLKNGKGKYIWSDDKYYDGYFCHGKRHGEGILYDHGKIIKAKWFKGKLVKDKELIKTIIVQNNREIRT